MNILKNTELYILNGDFMSNNSKTKNFEEIIVTLEDIDVSDEELGVEAGTKHAKKKRIVSFFCIDPAAPSAYN